MRECSEDVRLGMTRSSWSRLAGREALECGLEVKEGAMTGRSCVGIVLGRYETALSFDEQLMQGLCL
jgi:hypothetical protein